MDNTRNLCEVPQTELDNNTNFIAEKNGELIRVPWNALLQDKKAMEKVLLYYGYPIAINGAWSVENACNIYKNYDICVFGDEYNNPTHETHNDTQMIFDRLKVMAPETRLVGYVPIGLDPSWEDSNLSMEELKQRVDWWVDMGVNGIFLDEYGYDYYVTRARQNEIVSYCKNKGLFLFANSWSIEYVFNPNPMLIDWMPGFEPNPDGLPPLLDENDYYLYENLFYTTEKQTDGSLSLECASVWRINDVLGYYTNPKIDGKAYYDYYGTKICSLDGIPSTLDTTHKNILQSISVIGAAILNITAVAFGDENWGAQGYYHQWDVPDLDLATAGLNGVSVETREYTDEDGTISSFPYKWSANLNGHTYAIVFDIDDPNDRVWVDGKRYATANDVIVENAWMSIFDFQTDVREAAENAEKAIATAEQIQNDVNEVMPTLSQAEENIKAVVAEAQAKIDDATKQLEAGLADLETVTAGFQYKDVQW
ncbi:MAG: hypothetical protein Q4E24_14060 [bacterium]|nr:hypothetical protein [bacterium]